MPSLLQRRTTHTQRWQCQFKPVLSYNRLIQCDAKSWSLRVQDEHPPNIDRFRRDRKGRPPRHLAPSRLANCAAVVRNGQREAAETAATKAQHSGGGAQIRVGN